MASSSNFTIRDDMTFADVFRTLKAKFGLPLPPEEITQVAVGKEAFSFFTQTKFLLTYSRRNFAAAVREFEQFANLDNLADETLSKASGVLSTERRQAAVQKRRVRAFNQELKKQLQLFQRDGGSIATQGNQRQSVISGNPAGRQTVTERSSSVMKATEKNRQRILDWQHRNMATRTSESSNRASKSGLRTRASHDDEMNDAFVDFDEEPTEIDIEVDESGMIPARSFPADHLAGTLPEVLPDKRSHKTHQQFRPAPSFSPPPPSAQPLDTSVHSPPAKPISSQNHNWGRYVPPEDSLTQQPTSIQVPKPSNKHIISNSSITTASKENSLASSTPSDLSTRRLRLEDAKKRKQQHYSRNVMERPSKRQSAGPQDIPQPMNISPPRLGAGASSSRAQMQPSWTENEIPNPFNRSNARNSFATDTTEDSASDSMLQSRNGYMGTQPTSFNSTMEGKSATIEERRYDDTPQDLVPPAQASRAESHIGPIHSNRAPSQTSSRSVMRRGNRPASPSTQLQSEQEQASSRGSYSVGESTIGEMRMLGLSESTTNKPQPSTGSRKQSPPAARAASRAPAQSRAPSAPPTGPSPPQHHDSATAAAGAAQSRGPISRSFSSKDPKFAFYQTLEGEQFPGDSYQKVFHDLETPFWLQWEAQRFILTSNARNTETTAVLEPLMSLLKAFAGKPELAPEQAQDRFKEFAFSFKGGDTSIQNIKRDSYVAILQGESAWDDRIQLSAEFKLEMVLDPNGTGRQICKPTLRPRPLSLRSTSSRFDSKFGSHRFMVLRIPKIGEKPGTSNVNISYEAIATYLSHEGFQYLGRRWRPIYHRPASKDENGKRVSQSKQDPGLQVSIIMFAESGPGLDPHDQLDMVGVRSAMEWLIPIEPNLDMPQCKFYARNALGFSTTTPTVVFTQEQILYIDDIRTLGVDGFGEKVKFSLTDGCGLVSPAVLREIARALGLSYPPTAVQGRIAGAKGLWIADPNAPPESDEIWIKIRSDQNKFEGISDDEEHRTLHICGRSKSLSRSALNLQFIVILLHNGVTYETLAELLCEDIQSEFQELFIDGELNDDPAFLRKYVEKVKLNGSRRACKTTSMKGRIALELAIRVLDMLNAGFTLQNETLRDWFKRIVEDHCNKIREKMRIRISESAMPYCVPDPSGKLKQGQVYLRFGPESKFFNPKTMMPIDCLQGDVLIGRNPAHFGSDIQKVTAVDIPELRYLTDVIVFPADEKSHDRSLADYLSGGDYDGDRVWTCWDQRLVREFVGELEHGPSTVFLEQYFDTDRRKMRENFHNESPDAFANFMKEQLRIAMNDAVLGQCTSFFESYVYHKYGAEGGVLNLWDAKALAVVCGKLVDAPKQGSWPKPDYWNNLKNQHGKLPQPWYKRKNLKRADDLRNARESEHPIDKLKFQVAEDEISYLFKVFEDSCTSAVYRDQDLVAYSQNSFDHYTALMRSKDEVLRQKAEVYNRQKNHLNIKLRLLQDKWAAYWAFESHKKQQNGFGARNEFQSNGGEESEDSKAFIESCVDQFDNIMPCEDSSVVGRTLVDEWQLHARDPYSDWYRLKASLLHEKSRSTLPWFVAGDILCFEKWKAVSEERQSGFVIQPVARASRIKASALKTAADDRDWICGGPEGEVEDLGDSDGEDED
ncbi:hypothetical protein TWF281_005443 [Arthrobotrys megalospora]